MPDSGCAIAGGEGEATKFAFRDIIAKRAFDIIQPSVARCGGFTEAKKIAAIAEAWGVRYQPHTGFSPLDMAAALQMLAIVPDSPMSMHTPPPLLEIINVQNPIRDELPTVPMQLEDGYVTIPDGPGWALRSTCGRHREVPHRLSDFHLVRLQQSAAVIPPSPSHVHTTAGAFQLRGGSNMTSPHHISRRHVLQLGLSLATVGLAAACAPQAPTAKPTAAPPPTPAAAKPTETRREARSRRTRANSSTGRSGRAAGCRNNCSQASSTASREARRHQAPAAI